MNWLYDSEEVTEITEGAYGFVYELELSDGTKYIGKKNCYKKMTLPALKNGTIREGAERVWKNKNGKRIYFDIVNKETDWKEYTSSSDLVDSSLITKKTILEWAPSKRSLTYLEVKHQMLKEVLEDESYLNQNINGTWFKGRLL